MKLRCYLSLTSSLFGLALAVPSLGAAAQEAASDEAGGREVLEEIKVTARARQESLQDIPDAVKAFSESAIDSYRIDEYFDFARVTPGLSLVETSQSPGIALINIRGIGQQYTQEPPVAIIIDGVQVASAAAVTQALVDLERIEVVKGPQGALFGRNAIGGAINITSRQPTDEFSGYAEAGGGTNGLVTAEAALRGPVSGDRVRFSLAGRYSDYNGDFKNSFTGLNTNPLEDWFIRGRVIADVTDRLSADLRYSHSETENAGFNAVVLPPNDAGDFSGRPMSGYPGWGKRSVDEASARIALETGAGTLTSTTGYVDSSDASGYDLDQRPFDLIDLVEQLTEIEAFSEEIRLTSASDQRLRYTGGFYYLDTEQVRQTEVVLYPLVTGLPFPVSLPTSTVQNNAAWAAFAQVNYDVADRLELTLALRYDEDKRKQTNLLSLAVDKQTFDSLQPKVSLAYDVADDVLAYATYAQGFRSGGFNQPTPSFPLVYGSEETQSYEAGLKSQFLDRRIQVNAAFFYTEQDDQQVTLIDVVGAGAQGTVNIDKTSFTGFELETQALLADGLHLTAGMSYIDSKIKAFAAAPVYVGNRSPYSPEFTWTVGLDYATQFAGDWFLDLHVDYSGQSWMFYEYYGTIEQPSYGLTNFRIKVGRGAYALELFGENIFDEGYYSDVASNITTSGLGDLGIRGRRDRFGANLKVEF